MNESATGPGSSGDGALPDFSSSEGAGGQSERTSGPATLGEPSERALRRTRTTMIVVISAAVVILAVIALILSQTIFRPAPEPPPPSAHEPASRSAGGQSEYIPDPEDPDIAPPPPIFTQAPTTECTIPEYEPAPEPSSPQQVRGGDLEYTKPETWQNGWAERTLPYLTQVGADARHVEGGWYSVVNLGAVTFPEDEGGYPGLEAATVAIFQCYATTAGVVSHFGEFPEVTDYRSEPMTVDGSAAWIVQATYHFEDPEVLQTTSASIVTAIVVETPDGPSGLASDVAADQPEHAQELEDILASLTVVS